MFIFRHYWLPHTARSPSTGKYQKKKHLAFAHAEASAETRTLATNPTDGAAIYAATPAKPIHSTLHKHLPSLSDRSTVEFPCPATQWCATHT
jgi:hypothetical protein